MFTCPSCGKNTFRMIEGLKAQCSSCDYTIDYNKIPFLEGITKIIPILEKMKEQINKASYVDKNINKKKKEIDANELKLKEDDKT